MARLYRDREQKGKYTGWHKYIGVWLKDQLAHIQLQDVILIIIFIIFGILFWLILTNRLHLYHGSYTDRTEQLYLFSAIPQSLAAIFALTFSLLVVAIQHISNNYTPRAFRLHIFSIYYILFFSIFLYTIGYAIYLNGRFHNSLSRLSNFKIDRLELLFFLCLVFMVPFSIRAISLMRPREIMKRLSWKITERRFNNYTIDRYRLDYYLQSFFDMTKACINKADLRSNLEGLNFFSERIEPFIRRCENEASNSEMANTLFMHYLDAAYYANENLNCSSCMLIINSISRILNGYKASSFRSCVKIFGNFVERMERDIERFNNPIYLDRYMELHLALSELRDAIIDITT